MSWWLFATAVISRMDKTSGEFSGETNRIFAAIHRWLELEEAAGYRLTELLELLESGKPESGKQKPDQGNIIIEGLRPQLAAIKAGTAETSFSASDTVRSV